MTSAASAEPAPLSIEGELLVVRIHGKLVLDTVHQFVAQIKELYGRYGRYFLLIDIHESEDMPPDIRRLLAASEAEYPPAAAAVFGGGIKSRGLNALLQGAIVAFGGHRRNDGQFATEPEARAWLAKERQRLQAAE